VISNWPFVNLAKLCSISTGKRDANQGNPDGQYPFFTCAKDHIWSDTFSFDTKAILIAGNGQVGQSTYYEGKFEAYQRTYVLSDFHSVDVKFLYLYIDGFLKQHLSKLKMGNTMPYIKMGMLQNFEIPFPPLDEQKRIVAKLDEALGDLDQVSENSKTALEQIDTLWKSTLHNEFTSESENDERSACPMPSLGEVSSVITRGVSPVYVEDEGCAVINQRCIRDEIVNHELMRRHDSTVKPVPEAKKLLLGDLLINSTGVGTVGRVAVFCDNFNEDVVTVDSHVTIVRGIKTRITSDYLKYTLINFSEELISKAQGSGGQIELSRASIEAIKIPLPVLQEQKRIVAKLDDIKHQVDSWQKAKQEKIEQANSLRSSILSAAFAGDF
jgi:restriction endonuclease S subunit